MVIKPLKIKNIFSHKTNLKRVSVSNHVRKMAICLNQLLIGNGNPWKFPHSVVSVKCQ